MSKTVYLLVLGQGYTEAWYHLSKEEQDDLWAKVMEVDKRAGASGSSSAIRVGQINRSMTGV